VQDGRLVGFTDLQIPLAQPERAHQGGTLVLREHRGHRLGALMKAAVLRELAATFPSVRRVSTYNSDSNRPMVAVNEALGFRPAGRLSTWSLRLCPEPEGAPGQSRQAGPAQGASGPAVSP
jgi:RimJ/RimL family protein N-acetyltransferase